MAFTTQRGTYGDVKIRGATPDTRHSCNNKSAFASEINIPDMLWNSFVLPQYILGNLSAGQCWM